MKIKLDKNAALATLAFAAAGGASLAVPHHRLATLFGLMALVTGVAIFGAKANEPKSDETNEPTQP